LLLDRNVFVEVDENRHQFYEPSCELARLDSLTFGTDRDAIPTIVLRFNPHGALTLPFIEMIRTLVQQIKVELEKPLVTDVFGTRVIYMFYGKVGTYLVVPSLLSELTNPLCRTLRNDLWRLMLK
jgi:hypothetical protein